MRFPSFLCGTHTAVAAQCRKRVKQLAAGASWSDITADEGVDGGPGLIVLQGVQQGVLSGTHVFAHELVQAISLAGREAVSDATLAAIFPHMLAAPWSLLGLFGRESLRFFAEAGMPPRVTDAIKAERLWPFVDAVATAWPVLDGEGARYSAGLPKGAPLWSLFTLSFHRSLVGLGVPVGAVKAPLGLGGVRVLVPPRPAAP